MRKKGKSKLILLLICLAAFFVMGGCAIGETYEEALANRGLTARVTYYANGGSFSGSQPTENLYYKAGDEVFNTGNKVPTSGTATISRNNYVFSGWYYAVLDGEGNPVKEENGEYKLGAKVNFPVTIGENEHWHLVAKWSLDIGVQIKLAIDVAGAEIPKNVKEGEAAVSYKNGDFVAKKAYGTNDTVVDQEGKEPFTQKGKGYTFVDYYADEDCTELVSWPIKKADADGKDVVIYAKYIVGDWMVIRTPKDVGEMFSSLTSNGRYYFIKDVDATGKEYYPTPNAEFSGEIQGNGYTVSNLEVKKSQLKQNDEVSIFGKVLEDAIIKDLTLSDLTITYTLQFSGVKTYFAFTSLDKDAEISNVRLSGTMKVNKETTWLLTYGFYGGYASDQAYLDESGGAGFVVAGTADEVIDVD